ncbi:hypothetical protein [Streptomyces sp. NPDC087300]|uniref:hypothetical protein n=1 Tax=Streptomyces sp. NPDC087300 TaxID=3365780 RepID=UPI0037FF589C
MPRGRHRHSPPLHRLLPPSTVAGVSVLCAGGAWMFAEPVVLRGLVAAAAAAAVVGSVVMRRWDQAAGRRVAELGRARAGDEWRYEERIAEAESDLEESREMRGKLENKLRAKRAELAALRNEHAALLRRYATAETERASALEGRRLLAIEASSSAPALPRAGSGSGPEGLVPGAVDLVPAVRAGAPVAPGARARGASDVDASMGGQVSEGAAEGGPEGVAGDGPEGLAEGLVEGGPERASDGVKNSGGDQSHDDKSHDDKSRDDENVGSPSAVRPGASPTPSLFLRANAALDRLAPRPRATAAPESAGPAEAEGGDAQGKSGAADGYGGHERAVAVAPPVQARRPVPQGGFDFFGTKSVAPAALESVQNEDLADVVGEEALAVHKAEAEAEFKAAPQGDAERGVGQVIDLTAHDETEQIDVAGLRSALLG